MYEPPSPPPALREVMALEVAHSNVRDRLSSMVAPRAPSEPEPVIARAEPQPRIARLTVEQVERMLAAGILADGAPIELVDGVLLYKDRSDGGEDPMTIGKRHSLGVKLLGRLDPELERRGCHMQTQNPVRIPPHDEPEPDGAVLRGHPREYAENLPGPSDTYAVIEVADSSLDYDRTTKLALYARAGIAQYIIVNLRHHCVEVYERPAAGEYRYESVAVLRRGETLALRAGTETRIDVDIARLLP